MLKTLPIIGADLMSDIGIDLHFSRHVISWDGLEVLMKGPEALSNKEVCEMIYNLYTEPPLLQQEEERQQKILDADYSKVRSVVRYWN